jgi:hypothetical protein
MVGKGKEMENRKFCNITAGVGKWDRRITYRYSYRPAEFTLARPQRLMLGR